MNTNYQKGEHRMDSIEELYQKHAKTVYGFLLTKTQNPDIAEELTQETFYHAIKKLNTFQENSSVLPGYVESQKISGLTFYENRKNSQSYPASFLFRKEKAHFLPRRNNFFKTGIILNF